MNKFSVNDWLTIQSRKDLSYIRRSLEFKAIDYAIFADILVALLAFALDQIFWNGTDSNVEVVSNTVVSNSYKPQYTVNWYWIIVAIFLIAIPSVILLIGVLRKKRFQNELKLAPTVGYLVNLFDNEICYNIMTSDSMRDHLIVPKDKDSKIKVESGEVLEEEIKKFYFIEAMYYANKASSQLCMFKNQWEQAIQTESSAGGVPYKRFQNVSDIIYNIYKDLIQYSEGKVEYQKLLEDSSDEMSDFNDLMTYMRDKVDELKSLKTLNLPSQKE